ncbi:MAG TPA: SDR family oxidoreductase, partial [Acidimicrobiales bacterium]
MPDRVAMVTGAASGIGRAAVELFVERGFGIVAVDWATDGLRWADDLAAVVAVTGDVATEATNVAAVEVALDRWGRLDVAILNAGVVGSPAIEAEGAPERLDQVLAVNVKGVMLGIRHAAPAIRSSGGGAVVATASTSGLGGDPASWAYCASKAAVINLVRAAAIDYAGQGVRIN